MHRLPLSTLAALAVVAAAAPAGASTLRVGPGQSYAMPCDAIAAAHAGDTIEVDASGKYNGNTCTWTTDGLTISGVNGRAKIDLTGVTPSGQKGIFTIGGTASATIENFELSGAAISSSAGNNGAGIRHQGLNLTVRNCYIHDNQDGILAAPATANTGAILIENSEFSHNGAGDGFSHNMYIGNFASFTLQFSYSHDGNVGHLFKSRALSTLVLYNRITDETGGTASYEVDIPNAGTAYLIGNVIEQSATTQNADIVTFGEEGTPSGYDTHLFVVNNTFINDHPSGTFVNDTTSTPAVITNNIFYNAGTVTNQSGATLTTNFESATMGDPMFVNRASYDVTLQSGSPCIDKGSAPPARDGGPSLVPAFEYVHPLSDVARTIVGPAIDIGAYEYGVADDAGVAGPDASPLDASASGGSDGGTGSGGSSGGASGIGSGDSSAGGSTGGTGNSGSGSGSSGSASRDGGNAGAGSGSTGGCGCTLAGVHGTDPLGVIAAGGLGWLIVRGRRLRLPKEARCRSSAGPPTTAHLPASGRRTGAQASPHSPGQRPACSRARCRPRARTRRR
jgi:hypothetical protein